MSWSSSNPDCWAKYLTEHGQAILCCSSKSGDSGGRLMEARAVIDVPSQDNPLAF